MDTNERGQGTGFSSSVRVQQALRFLLVAHKGVEARQGGNPKGLSGEKSKEEMEDTAI